MLLLPIEEALVGCLTVVSPERMSVVFCCPCHSHRRVGLQSSLDSPLCE